MEIVQFKEKCILFYMESIKQIKQRFCFNEKQRLKCLKFMNPKHIIEKHAVTTIAHLEVQFPGKLNNELLMLFTLKYFLYLHYIFIFRTMPRKHYRIGPRVEIITKHAI